jgi:hypothetical protein
MIEADRPRRRYPDGREPLRGSERFIADVEETATAHRYAEDMWWQTVLDFYRVAAAGFAISICLIAVCGGVAQRGLTARRFFLARSDIGGALALSWFALFGGEAFSRTAPRPRRWWQNFCWRRRGTSAVIKSQQRAEKRHRRFEYGSEARWVEP